MSEIKKSKLCRCGEPADFIKDYWVSETKSKKQTEYDNMYGGERTEKACGIIRRRYCASCLSKIAYNKSKREEKYNFIIITSAVAPFLIGAVKYAYDLFVKADTTAVFPLILTAGFTFALFFSLLFKLGAGQKNRRRIASGKFDNLGAVDALIDSLTVISDWKTVRDLPASEIAVDGDGRVNVNLDRSGFFMRVVYEDRIGVESMRHRLKYDFDENAEYLKRSYLNAGFFEDNFDPNAGKPVKEKKKKGKKAEKNAEATSEPVESTIDSTNSAEKNAESLEAAKTAEESTVTVLENTETEKNTETVVESTEKTVDETVNEK